MPVPEGVITTSEVLYNLNPKEEVAKDVQQVPSDGDGASSVPSGDAGSELEG